MTVVDDAQEADVDAIAALEAEALGVDAWSRGLVAAGVRDEVPTVCYRVVRDVGGPVVGYAVVSVAGDVAELQRVAVAPPRRRAGLATKLLADAARLARAAGAERVLLEVREDNAAALACYAASGFAEIARRPRYYRDGTAAVVLELEVAAGG